MLRKLVSVLFILFVIGASAWAVYRFEPEKGDAYQEAKSSREKEVVDILASERVAYYTKVLAIFTGALSAFGILQIYFLVRADDSARLSANAALKSSSVAEATLRATQRAYVSVRPQWSIEPDPESMGNYRLHFWFAMDNQGASPALSCVNGCGVCLMDNLTDFNFDYDDCVNSVKEPGPPATIGLRSGIETSRIYLPNKKCIDILVNGEVFILCGSVEWDDLIENTPRRGFEWCYRVFISGVLIPNACSVRFSVHGDHNRHYDCPPETSRTKARSKELPDPREDIEI